jgi:hygromycin-B 7''-O-kinase
MSLPTAETPAAWRALLRDDAALAGGVETICERHGLAGARALRYASGSLPVYALGAGHVLKLFPPHEHDFASVEARVLAAVAGALPVPTPAPVAADRLDGWHYILMSQLRGTRLVDVWPQIPQRDRDRIADELGRCTRALHAIDIAPLADLTPEWCGFIGAQRDTAADRQRERGLDAHWLAQVPAFLQAWMPPIAAPQALLHTELMREHLLADFDGDRWRLTGLFDFEPAMLGAPEYDFASFGLFVACGDGRVLRRALLAYGYAPSALDPALQCRFMAWALLHRYSNLHWYLQRLPPQGETTLEQLAGRWWSLEGV